MFTCTFLCTFAAKDDKTTMLRRCGHGCIRLTGLSALMHFLVDGLCICCLYLTTAESTNIVMIYVTYNVPAFHTAPHGLVCRQDATEALDVVGFCAVADIGSDGRVGDNSVDNRQQTTDNRNRPAHGLVNPCPARHG